MWKTITLVEKPAVVMKKSEWTPDETFKDNKTYWPLVGQKCESIQISDQKELYKIGWIAWSFDDISFGSTGTIKVTFEPNFNSIPPQNDDKKFGEK